MCKCTPTIRTPWCGKPGCEAPAQVSGHRNLSPFGHFRENVFAATVDYIAGCKEKGELPDPSVLNFTIYMFEKQARKDEMLRIKDKIRDYFAPIITITDPQRTLEGILKAITPISE